jgi:hypothetical protein
MRTTTRALLVPSLAGLLFAAPMEALAQPSLTVSRIFNSGPLEVGENTIRVTVRNGSQTTPAKGPVKVKLIVLDPSKSSAEYEGGIPTGVGSNGSQTVSIGGVAMPKPGAYTITAIVDPDQQFRRYPTKQNERTEVLTVAGAHAAAAGPFQLLVIVKNQNDTRVNAARVSLRADGRELDWKRTGGTGEARFPKVVPSPAGKPYVIEVVATPGKAPERFEYLMPGQDAVFEAKLP